VQWVKPTVHFVVTHLLGSRWLLFVQWQMPDLNWIELSIRLSCSYGVLCAWAFLTVMTVTSDLLTSKLRTRCICPVRTFWFFFWIYDFPFFSHKSFCFEICVVSWHLTQRSTWQSSYPSVALTLVVGWYKGAFDRSTFSNLQILFSLGNEAGEA